MTDHDVTTSDVRLGSLHLHVAGASQAQGGVLLYPTMRGVDDKMRATARAFAEAGMSAVVWDPYNGQGPGGGPGGGRAVGWGGEGGRGGGRSPGGSGATRER